MIRHGIFALLVVATGWGCIQLGERGARALERLLIDRVENGWAVLEIDWAEKPYFPEIDEDVLAECIATYQQLGWGPTQQVCSPST